MRRLTVELLDWRIGRYQSVRRVEVREMIRIGARNAAGSGAEPDGAVGCAGDRDHIVARQAIGHRKTDERLAVEQRDTLARGDPSVPAARKMALTSVVRSPSGGPRLAALLFRL